MTIVRQINEDGTWGQKSKKVDRPQKSRHKKQNIYLNLYTSSFSDGESILLAE